MTSPTIQLRRSLAPLGFGLLAALGLAVLLAIGWMGVRGRDMADLTLYLAISGGLSIGLGVLALLWFRRGLVQLWLQITLTYMLGTGVAILNIFLTARLMFISSDHDLPLLILLMLFAAVVSLALGYALARALAGRVSALGRGAQAIANGDLRARVVAAGSDELAMLAEQFNRMAEQLSAAEAERARLESTRRDLIAAISHDLRTPLASLRVMTEALADGMVDDPATTARYLATMRSQIGQLSGLIDDLFELAQLDAGALTLDLQRTSIAELIDDAVDGLHPQAAAKGVQLSGSAAAGLAPTLLAPQKIGRVLANLLGNAIRHTPAGGQVTVAAGIAPAELSARRAVLVEVADTGEGIAPEDLPCIFERFYRGEKSRSRATGGAGLGLAIARGIVEAHGGRIWAERAERGALVRFTLPYPAEEPNEARRHESARM
jgi:signal transduction histidine kinase